MNGYFVSWVDTTIIAEQPKMAPFIDAMKDALSKTGIPPGNINIKAKTNEGMGFHRPGRRHCSIRGLPDREDLTCCFRNIVKYPHDRNLLITLSSALCNFYLVCCCRQGRSAPGTGSHRSVGHFSFAHELSLV